MEAIKRARLTIQAINNIVKRGEEVTKKAVREEIEKLEKEEQE
jgi:hypothetical protein